MYSNISSNDDDLFSNKQEEKTNTSATSANTILDDLEAYLSKKNPNGLDSVIVRTKLAHTLYDTANNFIFSIDSYNRTIFNTLNLLTDNKFALNLYADVLEESLAKRLIVFDFLNSVTSSSANEKVISFLSKKLNINVDNFFFNTYVFSAMEMFQSIIDYNLDIYLKVCNLINRQPLNALLEKDSNLIDPLLLDTNAYIFNTFSSIRKSIGYEL